MSQWKLRIARWQEDGPALRAVRETVFIHEQHVPPELEWDKLDEHCIHVLATDATENAIGTARLLADGTIGRMAVLKAWRGKGVGRALLLRLLEEAKKQHLQQVTLHAQLQASEFYRKLGFEIRGEEFMEAGIPHIGMVLKLCGRVE
ncbi:MAG TPA: GNAT family N-acetyltransferase [Nitrosospira sp.]|jgi:predicted GNAT family N-acyltransferase|nr:GNAT family N-acetyltransferase [Nitrosospira sp.]